MASLLEWEGSRRCAAAGGGLRLRSRARAVLDRGACILLVAADAFTADTLGAERAGNGVLIDDGLVLTIGYLITEAETVWLHYGDGRVAPGHALGLDSGNRLRPGAGARAPSICRRCRSAPRARSKSASAWSWAAPAGARAHWPPELPPSRNFPATGNTCWTRRSSPIRRIPTGAAPA